MKGREYNRRNLKNIFGEKRSKPDNKYNQEFFRTREFRSSKQFSEEDVQEQYRTSETRKRIGKTIRKRQMLKDRKQVKLLNRMVSQTVVMAAGTLVVASTYQNMTVAREKNNQERIVSQAEDKKSRDRAEQEEGFREKSSDLESERNQENIREPEMNENPDDLDAADDVSADDEEPSAEDSLDDESPSAEDSMDDEEPSTEDSTDDESPSTEDSSTDSSQNADTDDTKQSSYTVQWVWSKNNTSAVAKLKDEEGNIKEVKAVVKVTTKAASCTKAGSKTYTAEVKEDGKSYTDEKKETIPAAGHKFGDGKQSEDKDGNIKIEYSCKNCKEHLVVNFSIKGNDK